MAYFAPAVHFDGSASLYTPSLIAASGSGLFSFSGWRKFDSLASGPYFFAQDVFGSDVAYTQVNASGDLYIGVVSGTFPNLTLGFYGVITTGQWHHLLFCIDISGSTPAYAVYLDDVLLTPTVAEFEEPATVDWSGSSLSFNSDTGHVAGGWFVGDAADDWFAPGVSLLTTGDIPEATRRIFIDADGKPVDPFGFPASAVLFSSDAAYFYVNQGSGGDFILDGALTNASTSPSNLFSKERGENVSVAESAVTVLAASDAVVETIGVSESVVVYQDGDITVVVDTEGVSVAEEMIEVPATADDTTVENFSVSETLIVVLVSEPDAIVEYPPEGPAPPDPPPLPFPDIVDAHYQADGLVRIYYVDGTETTCDEGGTEPVCMDLAEWVMDGNTIGPYTVLAPTSYLVDIERDRRISKGIMVELASGVDVAMQTRSLEDFRNINFLVTTATTYKLLPALTTRKRRSGRTVPTSMTFRDAYNYIRVFSFDEMIEIGAEVTENVQDYYQAAWAIKSLTDIPPNYTDDSYWPDHSFPWPDPPAGYPGP